MKQLIVIAGIVVSLVASFGLNMAAPTQELIPNQADYLKQMEPLLGFVRACSDPNQSAKIIGEKIDEAMGQLRVDSEEEWAMKVKAYKLIGMSDTEIEEMRVGQFKLLEDFKEKSAQLKNLIAEGLCGVKPTA